jgi:hypothetical protein
MYFEEGTDVNAAIEREKQLKGWTRKRKIELIVSMNPLWRDLSEGWFDGAEEDPLLQQAEPLEAEARSFTPFRMTT